MTLGVGSETAIADDALVAHAGQWAAAGATYLVLRSEANDRRQWIDHCRRLGCDVLPRITRIATSDPLRRW